MCKRHGKVPSVPNPPPSRKRRPATTAISQFVEKKVEALRVRFMDSALAQHAMRLEQVALRVSFLFLFLFLFSGVVE